jgi:hypothetical protein
MQLLWNQIDVSNPIWKDPIDVEMYVTLRDQHHLHQFLMALHDDDFEHVRVQILHCLFPLWTLPSLNLSIPRLDRRLCALSLVIQCWLPHLLVLPRCSESIMTGQALLDSLLSLTIKITVVIVDVEGILLTSVGVKEDLMHPQ